MKLLVFFMGISCTPLIFLSNLCHIIWTWKNMQKNPQQLHQFSRVKDDLSYENKLD
jgi:hypothetical protein